MSLKLYLSCNNLSEKKKHGDPMVSLEKIIVYILTDVVVPF